MSQPLAYDPPAIDRGARDRRREHRADGDAERPEVGVKIAADEERDRFGVPVAPDE